MGDLQSIIDEALIDAEAALAAGHVGEAETLAREVLAAAPNEARAQGLLGLVALRCGEPAEAQRLLRQAFDGGARASEVLTTLADLCWGMLDFDGAANAWARALDARSDNAELWHRLGVARHRTGDVAAAVAALERAAALPGAGSKVWGDLGVALAGLGELAKAEAALARACDRAPSHERAVHGAHLAGVKARGQDLEGALALLREAAASGTPWILVALAQAQRQAGNLAAAVAGLRMAHAARPDAEELWLPLGTLLLEQGEFEAALAMARLRLRRHPTHAGALDLVIQATRAGARPPPEVPEPGRLLEPHWIRSAPLVTSALAKALAQHVAQHRTLRLSPYGHATMGGWHSGSLLVAPKGPVEPLEALLARAINQHGAFPIGQAPRQVALNLWGVIFRGEGHQSSHIHPDSWLSGVLYVELPEGMQAPTRRQAREGWLRFTAGPEPGAPVIAELEPQVGTLVVFPSYLNHETVHLPLSAPRISLAFDVVPLERS